MTLFIQYSNNGKVCDFMLTRETTPYGKDVKCKLVEKGMTQKDLASQVGTSKQYLDKILFGERAGNMYLENIDYELQVSKIRESTLTAYGKAVKCRLIELNMTQVELAKNLGTSKQYLGKILHGGRSRKKYVSEINRMLNL